jgi:hypothetical protein
VRDRRRWAAARGWEFQETDPVLPSRWRYGTIHQGGPGVARDLISGDVPTPDGPRQAYVFDHEQAGRRSSVLAAVQLRDPLPAAVELRLPSAPLPDDAGLDLLEPVGERYAFVADADAVRPLLTDRLAAGRRPDRRRRRAAVGGGVVGARHRAPGLRLGPHPGPRRRPRRGRHGAGAGGPGHHPLT